MTDEAVPVFPEVSPRVRPVPVDRPWTWLAAGWHDLMAAKQVSLAYGLLMVAGSWLVLLLVVQAELLWAVLPITAGFFLVAPLLAVGIYDTSRRLRTGVPVSLPEALLAWRGNAVQIGLMGAVLVLCNLFWVRVAMLLYAVFFGLSTAPTLDRLVDDLLVSSMLVPFLAVGTLVGLAFAVAVFAIAAVAIPMLLDRDVTVFTAVATSVTVVRVNFPAMALWAVLIVAFTCFGLVPFFFGLAVVMPLVGHATWHAYKDMVE